MKRLEGGAAVAVAVVGGGLCAFSRPAGVTVAMRLMSLPGRLNAAPLPPVKVLRGRRAAFLERIKRVFIFRQASAALSIPKEEKNKTKQNPKGWMKRTLGS